MRRALLVVLSMLMLTAAVPAVAESNAATAGSAGEVTAAEARRRYDAGDYAGAAAAFARAAADDPRDAALHYNHGAALFKAGKLGPAVAAFQRAYELRPRDSDIRHNLGFALERIGERLAPAGVPPALYAAYHWLGARELAGLFWLCAWAALLLGAVVALKPEARERLQPWLIAAALGWALAGGWWALRAAGAEGQLAVIVRPAAEIRSGPGGGFGVAFTAPEGRRVRVLGVQEDWLEIGVIQEGARGWIERSAVEFVWPN